jgi:hypothetical protein
MPGLSGFNLLDILFEEGFFTEERIGSHGSLNVRKENHSLNDGACVLLGNIFKFVVDRFNNSAFSQQQFSSLRIQ